MLIFKISSFIKADCCPASEIFGGEDKYFQLGQKQYNQFISERLEYIIECHFLKT